MALYNGSPVELDFVLPNIRSHSPGGKLPDPLQARVVKGDDAENTLRRYESLTHFSPVVVKSVCGGYLACGLSAGLRCGYPPPPLDTYLVKGCPGA